VAVMLMVCGRRGSWLSWYRPESDDTLPRYCDLNFPRWPLDLVKPEIVPFDPPIPKTPPRTKHEVDRTTPCRDMAI